MKLQTHTFRHLNFLTPWDRFLVCQLASTKGKDHTNVVHKLVILRQHGVITLEDFDFLLDLGEDLEAYRRFQRS